jgi:hypothetical protein
MSNRLPRIRLKETANVGPLKTMTETDWEENNAKLVRASAEEQSRAGHPNPPAARGEGAAPHRSRELAYEDMFLPSTEDEDHEP